MRPIIRAQSTPWYQSIALYIRDQDSGSRVKEIVLEDVPAGVAPPASFHLDQEHAQTLMDDLWNCGVRPTEGAGSAGAMRATERHLEDMRMLAFAREIPLPPKPTI